MGAENRQGTCPHNTPGCDFSPFDHAMMSRRGETCRERLARREASRAFSDRLDQKVREKIRRQMSKASRKANEPTTMKPRAKEDFFDAP